MEKTKGEIVERRIFCPLLNTINVGFCMNIVHRFYCVSCRHTKGKKERHTKEQARTHNANIQIHKHTHSLCQRLALLDYLRTHCLSLLQRSLSIKVADKLIIPQGHLLGAVWQQTGSIPNQCSINWLS